VVKGRFSVATEMILVGSEMFSVGSEIILVATEMFSVGSERLQKAGIVLAMHGAARKEVLSEWVADVPRLWQRL
jgi:hypothetical protein